MRARRHRNPDRSLGGWVADTAHADAEVVVAEDAAVFGNARVFGPCLVLGRARVYDFAWQGVYRFDKPRRLPAGTMVECLAHFDNSAGNFNNPNPRAAVKWGEQTWEEMMIGFVDYAPVKKK